jgi:hypothetical protein
LVDTPNVSAGTLNPHLPKRTIAPAQLLEWLEEADDADLAWMGVIWTQQGERIWGRRKLVRDRWEDRLGAGLFVCIASAPGYSGLTSTRRRAGMLDRDAKELLIGWSAILIFAVAIVYLRQ